MQTKQHTHTHNFSGKPNMVQRSDQAMNTTFI